MSNTEFELVGHELETPLVSAAGSVNGTNEEVILREVEALAKTAIGAITVGSFTVPRQEGNESKFGNPVYWHNPETGTTYNSMGLPNIGLAAARQLLPDIIAIGNEYGKPIIVSVSPTSGPESGGDTFTQVQKLVYGMQVAGAEIIEINTSCPNVVTEDGRRKPILGYDVEGMNKLSAIMAPWVGDESEVGLKLPPYLDREQRLIIPRIADILNRDKNFGFVTTCNTIPNQVPIDEKGSPILSVPGGAGGMSGPSTREVGREQLRVWRDALSSDIDVISTLGVDGGRELAVRRILGATAAGGVTFLWEQENWGEAVTNLISDWVEAEQP